MIALLIFLKILRFSRRSLSSIKKIIGLLKMFSNNGKGLFIQLYSIHGLIRGHDLELGRDADTGGQTKYVFELANMLSTYPEVEKVELITRWISDKKVSSDYAVPVEKVNDKFDIVRIRAGGGKYIRKELLWNYL
ncbi:MAG TPA: hypothetical protein VK870_13285, partial [Ignavibacteriaceae bacterium]|nr:hypothetical protein [Ignavibacteriaceae bacterium]